MLPFHTVLCLFGTLICSISALGAAQLPDVFRSETAAVASTRVARVSDSDGITRLERIQEMHARETRLAAAHLDTPPASAESRRKLSPWSPLRSTSNPELKAAVERFAREHSLAAGVIDVRTGEVIPPPVSRAE